MQPVLDYLTRYEIHYFYGADKGMCLKSTIYSLSILHSTQTKKHTVPTTNKNNNFQDILCNIYAIQPYRFSNIYLT